MFIDNPARLVEDMQGVAREFRAAMGCFDSSKETVDIVQNLLLAELFEHKYMTDDQLVGPIKSPLMDMSERAARESADPVLNRLKQLMEGVPRSELFD